MQRSFRIRILPTQAVALANTLVWQWSSLKCQTRKWTGISGINLKRSEKHNLYIKKHKKPHFAKRTMTSVHLDSWKSQDPVRHNWTTCFIIFILFESFWHNTRWRFCLFSEIYGMSQHDLPHIGGSCLRHVGHSIFTSIHLRNHAIRIRLALCLKDSQVVKGYWRSKAMATMKNIWKDSE